MNTIHKDRFGRTPEGNPIDLYTLKNANGLSASVTNLGCAVVSLLVPDKAGRMDDVVLGYSSGEEYCTQSAFLGVVAGRFANRIGKGKFELNGKTYTLAVNNMSNHLHGGNVGFDKKLWNAAVEGDKLVLSYRSPDGEEGYPGNLDTKVTYALSDDNALEIAYEAVSDADTVVNLTNHSYFNLAGHKAGRAVDQYLKIYADRYLECDSETLPTGAIFTVEGTPMDFRDFVRIGERIDFDCEQLRFGGGYDHNWIVRKDEGGLSLAAELSDKQSSRLMQVYSTKPGIQFYSGNFLDGVAGKDGARYNRRDGICLETQHYPDSINQKHFPSPVLRAGERYSHKTIYRFTTV